MEMWGILLRVAVGGLIMGVLIVVCSDVWTYLELQSKLREEKEN